MMSFFQFRRHTIAIAIEEGWSELAKGAVAPGDGQVVREAAGER